MRPLILAAALLLPLPLQAQSGCVPLQLSWAPGTVAPFETAVLTATGAPGDVALLGLDISGGPSVIPGFGTIHLGLTPLLSILPVFVPASGRFEFAWPARCKEFLAALHAQALTLSPAGVCLSNPAKVRLQFLGACVPPECVQPSTIASNFNGTAIAAGGWVWFNSIVRVSGAPASGATVGFRNSRITFSQGGTSYALEVPNAVITFSPTALMASTTYDQVTNQFETVVPSGYSGNVFLSGLAFPVGAGLPGGTNPVTWSGEFAALEPGFEFQWKWAAAAYTSFSDDYNALCIKPIDGSSLNPYGNSHHAGTPECFTGFVVGGARGGGGSNFTGSYSGTTTARCN